MTACAWCGQLAVTTVTVADEVSESKGGVKRLKHAAIRAPACAEHREVTERGTPPLPRQRRKPGPEQTTVFDFLDPA